MNVSQDLLFALAKSGAQCWLITRRRDCQRLYTGKILHVSEVFIVLDRNDRAARIDLKDLVEVGVVGEQDHCQPESGGSGGES